MAVIACAALCITPFDRSFSNEKQNGGKTGASRYGVAVSESARWEFVELSADQKCVVKFAGDEIDIFMMLNKSGELILAAGRSDWAMPNITGNIGFKIDASPSEQVEAHALNSLVLVRVSDSKFLDKLKLASSLVWELPMGNFHSDVRGIGAALSALRECKKSN